MNREEDILQHSELKASLLKFNTWDQLQHALQQSNDDELDTLIAELAKLINDAQFDYDKHTFYVREDLFQKMRRYCKKHHLTQKVFINIAIEALLNR